MERCAIWYHLYNLKNMKNTHGGVSILVKLQAEAPSFVFFTFLKLYTCYQMVQRTTYYNQPNIVLDFRVRLSVHSSTAWKVFKCEVISGAYFSVFGLNTEISLHSIRIQENTHQKQLRIWTLFTQ